MKCPNHPSVESQGMCTACGKPLCPECLYKVKSKPFCQDCIIQGAEWAPIIKGRRLSSTAPKWAAFWAIIPGIGAVFNNEYLKAIAYFSIFAWLIMMADDVNGIFGFGAAVFLIFTMFDAYRTAEASVRKNLESGIDPVDPPAQENASITWGVLLIIMGALFLLIKIVPQNVLTILWPIVFILLGGYLIYRASQQQKSRNKQTPSSLLAGVEPPNRKENM
jgi:hypothetical protein